MGHIKTCIQACPSLFSIYRFFVEGGVLALHAAKTYVYITVTVVTVKQYNHLSLAEIDLVVNRTKI